MVGIFVCTSSIVCMCVRVCVCVRECVYVCWYACMLACACLCTCVRSYVYLQMCIRWLHTVFIIYIYMFAFINA